jgi:hypothetical protein
MDTSRPPADLRTLSPKELIGGLKTLKEDRLSTIRVIQESRNWLSSVDGFRKTGEDEARIPVVKAKITAAEIQLAEIEEDIQRVEKYMEKLREIAKQVQRDRCK